MQKRGIHIIKRFATLRCSIWRKSATIKRAERKAVSPLVIGAATMPNIAKILPNVPNHSTEI